MNQISQHVYLVVKASYEVPVKTSKLDGIVAKNYVVEGFTNEMDARKKYPSSQYNVIGPFPLTISSEPLPITSTVSPKVPSIPDIHNIPDFPDMFKPLKI